MIGALLRSAKAVGVCLLLVSGAAHAQAPKDYNVFVFGNYTASGSDVEGRLAAGGNVTINSYSIGNSLNSSADSLDNIVAGGTLTMNNAQLAHGSAVAKTLKVGSSTGFPHGSTRTGSSGIDFLAEQAAMLSVSAGLASRPATGTANWQWGGYYLAAADAGVNIFNISGANLSTANNFSLTAASTAFAIVNVSGTSDVFQYAGMSLSGGITADHVLFNFSDATSLTFQGVSILGSVLAPKADLTFTNGNLNGTLIALSMTGGGEFHNRPYAGTELNAPIGVPEPASWAMMIGGFGLAGAVLRRSKRNTRAFA